MNLIRRRRKLWILRKRLDHTNREFAGRLRAAEAQGVPTDQYQSLLSEAMFEEDQIKEEIDALLTNQLLARASQLGVPGPDSRDEEMWVEARYTGLRHSLLTARGIHHVRDSIRDEQRKRRDRYLPWAAPAAALASAVAACLAVWFSSNQGTEIANLTRMQRALAYAPKWDVTQATYIVKTAADSFRLVADTVEVAVSTSVRLSITLKNNGSARGRLLGQLSKDTPSAEDDLRGSLLGLPKGPVAHRPTDSFWTYREVSEGDTINLTADFTLKHREGGWGTLHVLVLYENAAGDLYDTYYWTRYTSKHGLVDLAANDPARLFTDLFRLDSRNQSCWVYSEEERQTALNTGRSAFPP